MNKASIYDGQFYVLYFFNAKKISVEDFIQVEKTTMKKSAKQKFKLFTLFISQATDVYEIFSHN